MRHMSTYPWNANCSLSEFEHNVAGHDANKPRWVTHVCRKVYYIHSSWLPVKYNRIWWRCLHFPKLKRISFFIWKLKWSWLHGCFIWFSQKIVFLTILMEIVHFLRFLQKLCGTWINCKEWYFQVKVHVLSLGHCSDQIQHQTATINSFELFFKFTRTIRTFLSIHVLYEVLCRSRHNPKRRETKAASISI